jgi:acetoin utilization protein AcuB
MIAKNLITQGLPTLQTSDSGEEALNMMQIYHVRHLPIVNHEQLLGVLSEEDILIQDTSEPIGDYRLHMMRPFCNVRDHIFEVLSKMAKYKLTIIPVIDEEERYMGAVTMEDLLHYFSEQYALSESGSIIILETVRGDYSLAEIARIAESEDVTILSTFLQADPDQNKIYITLKVNKQEIHHLKAAFERYGYIIQATFAETGYVDALRDRYDSLMNYLNV